MRDKDIPIIVQRCLQEHNVDSSHVDPLQIMRSAGVKVLKNSSFDEASEWRLDKGTHGLSIHRYDTGEWFVIYDDSLSLEEKRFTIAHELGHIFLKHHEEREELLRHIEQLKEKSGRRAERQADRFAEILLNKKSPIQTAPTKVTSV